ncbi:MAG TPA: preprotein translocase subunit SecG [Tissierellaceae bacterium]|nr:preprotein translocase subunit SecG [Tissierellaceae bacterium]
MQIFFSVLILLSSLTLIISVLLQEGNDEGIGSLGGNSPDSLWGKSRGTSKETLLQRVTIVAAVIFMVSALILAAK